MRAETTSSQASPGRRRLAALRAAVLILAVLGAACGADPPKPDPAAPPPAPKAAPAPRPAAPPAAKASDPAELRKRTFTDADFVKAEDNRDPFEYSLRIFVTNTVPTRNCIAQKLAIDELKLVGIVAGVSNPTALFRDPGGGAIRLRTNDQVGRQCARVKRIIHEVLPPGPEDTTSHDVSKVIFEITEESAGAQPRLIEKIVWLNPEEQGR
jgi:hypothetical protein